MNIRRKSRLYCSSTLTTLVLILYNLSQLCETKQLDKTLDDNLDLMYSDTSHGPLTAAAAHQQVVFIDHGGGAISQIRRTSYLPSVPSLPFRPHVNHYPNSLFENNFVDEPYVNAFPDDIPRILDRHTVPIAPNPMPAQPHQPLPHSFIPHDPRAQQPIPQSLPQPIPQVIHQPFPQHLTHPIPQPMLQPIQYNPNPQHISHQQLIQHGPVQQIQYQPLPVTPMHQPNPDPTAYPIPQPIRHSYETDIENERYLINNEIERIPKPSNNDKPTRREPPPPPPPPPTQIPVQERPVNPFFNFADTPEIFPNFDSGFDAFSPQNVPQNDFQRRRLTTNNQLQDVNNNAIGYPPYNYYKGGDDNPSLTNWPKIFKFTDGRSNLYEFEKQKKQNKIKFNSKDTYFDHISRDSFLILHGGTFAQ